MFINDKYEEENIFRKRQKLINQGVYTDSYNCNGLNEQVTRKLFNTAVNKSSIKLSYINMQNTNNEPMLKSSSRNVQQLYCNNIERNTFDNKVEESESVKSHHLNTASTSINSHGGSNASSRNSWTGPTNRRSNTSCKLNNKYSNTKQWL
jgi:hypothetical protein